jgi:hypothetical protein
VTGYLADLFPHYAFIRGDDGLRYFLFRTGLQATTTSWEDLRPGDALEFLPIAHSKGPRAIEAKVTGRAFEPAEEGWA